MERDAVRGPIAAHSGPSSWQRFREPLGVTVARNATIAFVVGGVAAWRTGRVAMWPVASCLALWPTFGGHLLEVWYLNSLRPRLEPPRATDAVARLVVWFIGGILLGKGVALTMRLSPLTQGMRRPSWWMYGVIFIVVELIANAMLSLRRRPNFYEGAG